MIFYDDDDADDNADEEDDIFEDGWQYILTEQSKNEALIVAE